MEFETTSDGELFTNDYFLRYFEIVEPRAKHYRIDKVGSNRLKAV